MNRKCCGLPSRICCMTITAVSGYSYRLMIWISCTAVCSLMTGITICRCSCKTLGMAGSALYRFMCSCQRERSIIVIKVRWRPSINSMALLTFMGKVSGNMIRICSIRKILCMARIAISRKTFKIISLSMAGSAFYIMSADQRKEIVIEISSRPDHTCNIMAFFAVC